MPAQVREGGPVLKNIRWFWLAAALTMAADLASKYISFQALGGVPPAGHICDDACGHYVWVAHGVLRFINHYNTGGAFGLASGNLALFLAASAVLVPALVLTAYFCRAPRAPLWSLGLIVGGAIGNLYDRLFHVGVRDFIEIINPRSGRALWPVFNIADIAIVVGVAAYLLWSLLDAARTGRAVRGDAGGEGEAAAE
ncbi:MAG: signal peptidase II [Planctomycetota bacterium]|nr:signal peptidase II [Planctomycetota bacterium]